MTPGVWLAVQVCFGPSPVDLPACKFLQALVFCFPLALDYICQKRKKSKLALKSEVSSNIHGRILFRQACGKCTRCAQEPSVIHAPGPHRPSPFCCRQKALIHGILSFRQRWLEHRGHKLHHRLAISRMEVGEMDGKCQLPYSAWLAADPAAQWVQGWCFCCSKSSLRKGRKMKGGRTGLWLRCSEEWVEQMAQWVGILVTTSILW